MGTLYPDVVNIFEMGGENSKYIRLSVDDGVVGIVDYETNGDCAAGTGSFMDQQSSRLRFAIEDPSGVRGSSIYLMSDGQLYDTSTRAVS